MNISFPNTSMETVGLENRKYSRPDAVGVDPAVIYSQLMAVATGDDFDAHVFASNIALAHVLNSESPGRGLGLTGLAFMRLLTSVFSGSGDLVEMSVCEGEDALEEPDLRALLLSGRAKGTVAEEWMAAIVARSCQRPNHLWQDLGLRNRGELSQLLHRHFPGLAGQNVRDMKWKKFFYRQLCQAENVPICKSPVCDACADFAVCFGAEDANPLVKFGN